MTERTEHKDRGAALLVVIGIGLVMVLMITTGLSVALSGMRQASGEADYDAALDAAYAGVQDYLARVNADSSYTNYGNPASTFSAASSVKLPKTTNAAFNVKAGQAWAAVPGSNGRASFRYEVDTSVYKTTGVVAGPVDRARRLHDPHGALEHPCPRLRGLHLLHRLRDPGPEADGEAGHLRAPRLGGPRPELRHDPVREDRPPERSRPLQRHPRHLRHSSTARVTTANPKHAPLREGRPPCPAPKFGPGNITHASTLPMPQTNSRMKAETRSDSSSSPGCLYTGPDHDHLQQQRHDDRRVPVDEVHEHHGDVGQRSGPVRVGRRPALRSRRHRRPARREPALRAERADGLVRPELLEHRRERRARRLRVPGHRRLDRHRRLERERGWRFGTTQYPAVGEAPASGWYLNGTDSSHWDTTTPAYGCRSGDLFVKGKVTTQTTAGSENYIYVTGDITYGDKNSDVLGLVGQNGVLVWNPMSALNLPLLPGINREIDAAIVSVAHTFQVQNFDQGPVRGTLTLFGSLAQKFRGPAVAAEPTTTPRHGIREELRVRPAARLGHAAEVPRPVRHELRPRAVPPRSRAAFTAAGAPE